MQEYITYQKALNKAMYLCSKAEKCKEDIRKKLYDWKANPSEFDKIISDLERQKFIDEERYVKYYVRDKFEFNKWGKIKIRTMLYRKKISKKKISKALENISQEKYVENLKYLLNQKRKTIRDSEARIIKNKLMRFAASRGYEPDLILSILNR